MSRFWQSFLLLSLLSGFIGVQSAMAQAVTVVTVNQVEVNFPDAIIFQLEADSAVDIEEATLMYGTNSLSCQQGGSLQPVDVEDGTAVSLSWEWELKRSGALPPGTEIWWQWELIDSNGDKTTTEQQSLILEDNNHDWQELSQDGVTVSWYLGSPSFGQAMLDEATTSLARIASEVGVPVPENIQLWFYPSGEAVQEAIVNVPEWTGGVAFPEYGITVLGVPPGEFDWAAQIVPHELTHLVVGVRVFNCRGIHLPTWLNEGLARYSEGEMSFAEREDIDDALKREDLPPLPALAAGFSAYSDAAGLAYTQSHAVVRFLIETYGPEMMDELLETMQSGQQIDDALETIYGFDTGGLDAVWRTELGYMPTPTAVSVETTDDEAPTPVPTLALGGVPAAQVTDTPEPTATTLPPTDTPPTATATLVPTEIPATATEISATTVLAEETAVATATPIPPTTEPVNESPSLPWLPIGAGVILALFAAYFILQRKK